MNIWAQLSLDSLFGSSSPPDSASKYEGYLGVGKFEDGFDQWRDAMKAVTRLPDGLPANSRRKMWLTLAEHWLESRPDFDWAATRKMAFNEMIDPEDDELDYQIVKDLHRTGCSSFSGRENDQERALLKRVLLAYARWNKAVGYCQGFNVIAAVILDVMDRHEGEALKVMIFLVDGVLPKSYFTDNLRDLAVDMAVFSDLLATHLPRLHAHLERLRQEEGTSAEERPPLTDVFTMQWFLTLFATQLPGAAVLRVWDAVFLEGSEILIRTSLALWGLLQEDVLREIRTADDFYTQMGEILARTVDASSGLVEVDRLMTIVYQLAPFPLPQLRELRARHFQHLGSQKSELEKWQKRLRDRHAQASQYLQLTPRRLHKSYQKVTGLVLPSVPAFASDEAMINHLKLPRQTSAPAVVVQAEAGQRVEDANRHVLRIGAGSSSVEARTPHSTPSPTPPVWDLGAGVKPKSRSPPPLSSTPDGNHSRSSRSDSGTLPRRCPPSLGPSERRERKHESHPVPESKGEQPSPRPTKSASASSSSSQALYHLSADHRGDSNYRQPSPFPARPGQSQSRQRAEYGIKLGLYAPQKEHAGDVHRGLSEAQAEEGRPEVTRITRHHINACMARESEAYHGGGFPR